MQPNSAPLDRDAIAAAAARLQAGELVAMPTETVYGLAADARNLDAVRKIYALKGRPVDHPLIVHLAPEASLADWAAEVPPAALQLAARYWPGPLTLILKRAPSVLDAVTGGQDTVGLRKPAHPVAQALLRAFGGGLAAPSANRYGQISPTRAEHVREEFGAAAPLILEGGAAAVGIESTIVDLSGEQPRLLRPGAISRSELESLLGPLALIGDHEGPRASGRVLTHYAPRTPLRLATVGEAPRPGCVYLSRKIDQWQAPGMALPDDPEGYARDLYDALRSLDRRGADAIIVRPLPDGAEWEAVRDRLSRAAAPR